MVTLDRTVEVACARLHSSQEYGTPLTNVVQRSLIVRMGRYFADVPYTFPRVSHQLCSSRSSFGVLRGPVIVKIAHHLCLRDRLALLYTCKTTYTALAAETKLWDYVRVVFNPARYRSQAVGAGLVLARAGAQPVRLGASGMAANYLEDPDIDTLITNFLPRLAILEILLRTGRNGPAECSLDDALQRVFRILRGEPRALRTFRLSITMLYGSYTSSSDPVFWGQPLPADIFSGQTPHLQRLELQGVRLSAGVNYSMLRNLTVLSYESPKIYFGYTPVLDELLQSELDNIMCQTTQLERLTLAFASYIPTTQNADKNYVPRNLRYVQLHRFGQGGRDLLDRFAHAPVLDIRFREQLKSDDFYRWPSASIHAFVLWFLKEDARRSHLLHKFSGRTSRNPTEETEDTVSVFIAPHSSAFAIIPPGMVTTLTMSEALWAKCLAWTVELPQLTELRFVLSTCSEGHEGAGSIWRSISEAGNVTQTSLSSPLLRGVVFVALHHVMLPDRYSHRSKCPAVCVHRGTYSLSMHDVASFLVATLVPEQRIGVLNLVGITYIVDVNLEAAFERVLRFTDVINFESDEAVRYEEKGMWMKGLSRALFPEDNKLNNFKLRSPFVGPDSDSDSEFE